jgi:hypothetical protein
MTPSGTGGGGWSGEFHVFDVCNDSRDGLSLFFFFASILGDDRVTLIGPAAAQG